MTRLIRALSFQSLAGAGVLVGSSAICLLVLTFTDAGRLGGGLQGGQVLTLLLIAAIVIAYQYPLHIRHHSKVVMTTVPRYILAVLLPPPLAILAVVLGTGIGELTTCKRRGLYAGDVATELGRMMPCVLAASIVTHAVPQGVITRDASLLAAGALLWATDVLTVPLGVCPMSGERPAAVIRACLKGAGLTEVMQYVVGIFGAMLAQSDWLAVPLMALPLVLVYLAFKHLKEVQYGARQVVENMADTVDLRDQYTGGHSRRVTDACRSILREMGIHGPEADLIIAAARVHDIGKIAVPDGILNKTEGLTDEEWEVMATHPQRGAELLARYPDFARGAAIVRHHHERWDGRGYPDKLRAAHIPLGSRIIAVADAFDAMTTSRPYSPAKSVDQACAILQSGRGRQWDPQVVDTFLGMLGQPVPQIEPLSLGARQPAACTGLAIEAMPA